MKSKMIFRIALAVLSIALVAFLLYEFLQPPYQGVPSRQLTVKELMENKEEFLNKEVIVIGKVGYGPIYCTEMYCYFPSVSKKCEDKEGTPDFATCLSETPCEPGEKVTCNSCGAAILLKEGSFSVELRKTDDGSFSCTGREVMVCGGETEYDFSGCAFAEGREYQIWGVLEEEKDVYSGESKYYIEVISYIETA